MANADVGSPADMVDVTEDVNALKDEIHELFRDRDAAVISLAIGASIAEVAPEKEWLKQMLYNIVDTAGQVFEAIHQAHPPEEGTLH